MKSNSIRRAGDLRDAHGITILYDYRFSARDHPPVYQHFYRVMQPAVKLNDRTGIEAVRSCRVMRVFRNAASRAVRCPSTPRGSTSYRSYSGDIQRNGSVPETNGEAVHPAAGPSSTISPFSSNRSISFRYSSFSSPAGTLAPRTPPSNAVAAASSIPSRP